MDNLGRDLISAVVRGEVNAVSELLQQNVDVNFTTSSIEEGFISPLHVAVANNETEILRLLLENGADVNKENEDGETPIFLALYEETDDIILEFLLKYGADVNHQDKAGHNALQKLFDDTRNLDEDAGYSKIRRLISFSGDEACRSLNTHKQTYLHFIESIHRDQSPEEDLTEELKHSCVEFIEMLVSKGLSVNAKDVFGLTPLHSAVMVSCSEAVECLFQNGAIVQTDAYHPLLHFLTPDLNGFGKTLTLLLSNGCDINERNAAGKTPLHAIILTRGINLDDLDILLLHGADLNAKDHLGNTLLHECVAATDAQDSQEDEEKLESEKQCIQTICSLVKRGVAISAINSDGLTALHYAVETRGDKIVKTLITLGACVNMTTKTGESALHRATKVTENVQAIFDTCNKYEIEINAGDIHGSSPLHWAVWFQNIASFAILLQNGADLDITDEKGRTPVDLIYFLKSESLYSEIGIATDSTWNLNRTIKTEHNYSLSVDSKDEHAFPDSDSEEEAQWFPNGRWWEHIPDMSCNKNNIFGGCRLISQIYNDDADEVSLENWKSHLSDHKDSLKTFASLVLHSSNMGLYHETVDNKELPTEIEHVLRNFTERLALRQPMFGCQLILAGSRNERTKVGLPDEFDYILKLTKFSEVFEPVESEEFPNGFIRLHLIRGVDPVPFEMVIDSDGYLDGMKVVEVLYKEFNKSILELETLKRTRLFPMKFLEPAKGSIDNLVFRWIGATYKNIEISVDLVPSVCLHNWTPQNSRECKLLNAISIKPLCSAVLKTQSSDHVKDWNTYFRLSTAEIEANIIKMVSYPVRQGYILLKTLKDSNYFPHVVDKTDEDNMVNYISTYMLKSAFLYELEKNMETVFSEHVIPNLHVPGQDMTVKVSINWARKIVDNMLDCIEKDSMPVLLNDHVNLLLDASGRKIVSKQIYKAQCLCLQYIMELISGSCIA